MASAERPFGSGSKVSWAAGDFPRVAPGVVLVGELLCEEVGIRARQRVLDVATANGNTALSAARRRARVAALDLVPAWISHGRRRALVEGLEVDFLRGDAERLPFPDGRFDCVLSTFGVGFAPHPAAAASELLRVLRSGGTLGLAHWTDRGFAGPTLDQATRYLPASSGPSDPYAWARRESLERLFGDGVTELRDRPRTVDVRADSVETQVNGMLRFLGPVARAYGPLEADSKAAFRAEMIERAQRENQAADGTALLRSEYLEVVARRR